ncbi:MULTISPECIES: glycoside hydrolase family 38 C-terminal domain-containing protein [unclassified Oceanispirochaeta]|uniref:alpha-mannosidase n=1 Tax=unclassified Oceanispirochaeta TaxID=2635722 RepID=UPI000E0912C0|nr:MULTISPECIES: glycoside hydrolase family 38 C-terminal domain-containing protein [unclassified Oceanispirochaeta]MBF9015026.1 alpha-mannosidase [Oceanispirochaeta sp. M2]NPD71484.1 alpha-mannosidase [Oceanispirochaeta sp. M1]RDG33059.1 alpha-mannosidase [Oceanispirochaeta sp. M1]
MLYKKTEARIRQYLSFLDSRKYTELRDENGSAITLDWEYGVTDTIFRQVPDDAEISWNSISAFPYAWGEENKTWWFRAQFENTEGVPVNDIFLRADTQTDTLVFLSGIPAGALNPFHKKLRLNEKFEEDGKIGFALEAWAGHLFPGYHPDDGPRVMTTVAMRQKSYPLIFEEPRLLIKNAPVYDLYYNAKVLFETASLQEEGSLLRTRLYGELFKALIQLDFTSGDEDLSTKCLDLGNKVSSLLERKNGTLAPRIFSQGNAHLDHAWLWPLSETSRKCARTCANMASYLEEFPEFRFLFSQPVQMLDLKENYPDIFLRVKAAFDRGQWEPNGGMWVEADCNLSGGESLIRQFLIGRQTTRELFGYTSDVLWLPDVFGYTAGLPQILKGCGIRRFITSKISWNDTTRFPYDLFRWEGIDGTEIPTHFITTAYEGRNNPEQILESWNKVQHKECQESLYRSIGEGDGGGGTMRSDLEMMRRMNDLQGLPRNSWSGLSESLDEIGKNEEELPVFRGELYLELHRGTYTTQAGIKRFNRKLEYKIRELELKEVRLFLQNSEEGRQVIEKHKDQLRECWKTLLTMQFHDILPGTSIRQVNVEALEQYGRLEERMDELGNETDEVLISDKESKELTFSNSLPFDRITTLRVDSNNEGSSFPVQTLVDQNGKDYTAARVSLKGLSLGGADNLCKDYISEEESPVLQDHMILSPYYSIALDNEGGFSSFVMKESGRELISPDRSFNEFLYCEDFPVNWDAWDIEEDYRLKERRIGTLLSREVLSSGSLCLQLRQVLDIGDSSLLTQDIFFYAHSPRIDFITTVDWQERHRLLRVDFPTSLNCRDALFDIPFGYVKRDSHTNYNQNRAQFEVCAHKWARIADTRMQAAVLSDCKYGYRVDGGSISLTLLRSPSAPDPEADRGIHEFTYSFYPDESDDISAVIKEGWDLNIPAQSLGISRSKLFQDPLFHFSSDDIMVESLKIGEDGDSVVLRVWETKGAPLHTVLNINHFFNFSSYCITNMLEDEISGSETLSSELILDFKSFEIKTIKFYR